MAPAGSSARSYVKSSMRFPFVARGSSVIQPGLCVLDGGNNVRVGAATAEIAAHLLADFSVRMSMLLMQQPQRGADLARCAIAALKGIVLDERLLQGMKPVAGGQALDGCYSRSSLHDGEDEARINSLAVDQYCAGAT